MSVMFWIWLSVIAVAIIIEMSTTELISIWFAFGAVPSFILSACTNLGYEWQILMFIVVSAILILCFRKMTKKWLLKNTTAKTNLDALIGEKFRMLSRTDFETMGKVKVKDVEWSVKGENSQTIEEGEVIEVTGVSGNKLLVKPINSENNKDKKENNKK